MKCHVVYLVHFYSKSYLLYTFVNKISCAVDSKQSWSFQMEKKTLVVVLYLDNITLTAWLSAYECGQAEIRTVSAFISFFEGIFHFTFLLKDVQRVQSQFNYPLMSFEE